MYLFNDSMDSYINGCIFNRKNTNVILTTVELTPTMYHCVCVCGGGGGGGGGRAGCNTRLCDNINVNKNALNAS